MLRLLLASSAAAATLVGCATTDPGSARSGTGSAEFTKHVKPLFERRCVRCHNRYQLPAGLNFNDREAVLTGTRAGTEYRFIVPGSPEQSLIYLAITQPAVHPNMMPGDGWGLTKSQEQHVHDWIKAGAPWPEGFRGRLREKSLRVEFDDQL